MKTKLQKSLKYFSGAAFLFALTLNVIVTLDDPFVLMSDRAIAETTSTTTGTTTTTGQSGKYVEHITDTWVENAKFDTTLHIWVVVGIEVEGSVSHTFTRQYDCCAPGGNNCSANNPDC